MIGWSAEAQAHGTNIEYRHVQAVQVDAAYAGGQPMANAQVTVYAPDNPADPWMTGTTDEEGLFSFTPDYSQPGNWEVKVRQAGHGDLITVPVSSTGQEEEAAQGENTSLSWLAGEREETMTAQKALLGAAGVWGFFGTALFFARRKTN
ncbi:MAG: carboxypeptidase regulatory-like domain-containing protein [Cyanophyceae cyanobacterium]